MKVELHLHTSRYSPCAGAGPDELMAALIAAGYEAVYITEHERMWSHWEIRLLQSQFPQIKIFSGVELSIGLGAHLLVLGTTDQEYLWLQSEPTAVLAKARAEGHLTILAHPYRWPAGAELLATDSLPDALEHRTNNHFGDMVAKARQSAEELGLKLVNTGDIHSIHMIDHFWIDAEFPLERPGDIKPIIMGDLYTLMDNVE